MWTPDSSGEGIGTVFLISLLMPWVVHLLYKKESVKLVQNLRNNFNLVDVWRLCNPTYENFYADAQNQLQ